MQLQINLKSKPIFAVHIDFTTYVSSEFLLGYIAPPALIYRSRLKATLISHLRVTQSGKSLSHCSVQGGNEKSLMAHTVSDFKADNLQAKKAVFSTDLTITCWLIVVWVQKMLNADKNRDIFFSACLVRNQPFICFCLWKCISTVDPRLNESI